jgi:predicted ATPase/DNA-binding CsgD family transcriptional regulator
MNGLQHPDLFDPLSKRELEILKLMADGLSNQEIGQQLFLTAGTVKWYNKHIFTKLGTKNRTQATAQARLLGLLGEPAFERLTLVPRSNLPPCLTSFVGRVSELDDVVKRLEVGNCRLLSLIGPGGIGKTRLAIEAGLRVLPKFKDGVFFVALETVHSNMQIAPAIANACEFQFSRGEDYHQQLLDFLRDKHLLLVLDNFEHLLEGTSLVSALLTKIPDITLLVTSRSALQLHEECTIVVQGMAFPSAITDMSTDSCDAVQLFLDRAKRVRADVSLQLDGPWIARICQTTLGMPLAIELAASWLRTLSCQEIAREIEQTTDFLTASLRNVPERHRSLRAVFQWSWDLLGEQARQVYTKLSVFHGGFSRDALEMVTGASLAVLSHLIDKSLVHTVSAGRYDLHPLLREYAQEQLHTAGQAEGTRVAHSRYYLSFLAQRTADLKGKRQVAALREVHIEFDNLRAAWHESVKQKDFAALNAALEGLDVYEAMTQEGSELLVEAYQELSSELERQRPSVWRRLLLLGGSGETLTESAVRQLLANSEIDGDHQTQGMALLKLREIAMDSHDYDAALGYLDQAHALYEQLGEKFYVAIILGLKVFCYKVQGQQADAAHANRQALAINRDIGNLNGLGGCIAADGDEAFHAGDYTRAEASKREALRIHKEIGDRAGAMFNVRYVGLLRFIQGDLVAARECFREALETARILNREWPQFCAVLQALLCVIDNDYAKADLLFEESRAASIGHLPNLFWINWGQALSDYGLQRYAQAKTHSYAALMYAQKIQSVALTSVTLPICALVLANEGQKCLAVEVLTKCGSATKWVGEWTPSTQLMNELKFQLGPHAFDLAWTSGTARRLDEVTTELMAYLSVGCGGSTTANAELNWLD